MEWEATRAQGRGGGYVFYSFVPANEIDTTTQIPTKKMGRDQENVIYISKFANDVSRQGAFWSRSGIPRGFVATVRTVQYRIQSQATMEAVSLVSGPTLLLCRD